MHTHALAHTSQSHAHIKYIHAPTEHNARRAHGTHAHTHTELRDLFKLTGGPGTPDPQNEAAFVTADAAHQMRIESVKTATRPVNRTV